MIYKAPRGTSDLLEPSIQIVNSLFEKSRDIFNLFGFKEIVTPIFEDSRLFVRSLGNESDIITKQMLNIETKDKPLTLRPEGTASIIRAYLEHHLDRDRGLRKLFYIGPMFRGERPQKGRLRQFTHIGAEAIGSRHPAVDAEVIILVAKLLDSFGLCDYKIILNSVGCLKDKQGLEALLREELKPKASRLCEDCQRRLTKNIVRVLDCKKQCCRKIIEEISCHQEFRCPDCAEHFKLVKELLSAGGIKYKESPFLVRGLDYYTGTVFEITHSALGSQDALGAGGRYDNLVAQLGGPEMGAVGFALGLERLILALNSKRLKIKQAKTQALNVFVVLTKDEYTRLAFLTLGKLRDAGISADMDYTSRSLKGQMRRANNLGASFVLLFGDDEVKESKVSIKDMRSGQQEIYPQKMIVDKVKELLKKD